MYLNAELSQILDTKQANEINVFWQRLGGKPNLIGKTVLDLGCAEGYLTLDLALSGAKKIVGLDIDSNRILKASSFLKTYFTSLYNRVVFHDCDLIDYSGCEKFDIIVSKNTFEHIINLRPTFQEMINRLVANGLIFVGFSYIYKSPIGHHGRLGTRIPWGHLILPESFILRLINRKRISPVRSIQQIGLNKLGINDYNRIFYEAGLKINFYKTNQSRKLIAKVFSAFTRFPFLADYFTFNLYCILEKR
jgi:cyclopropane fatty-acyl-phospholipid synthase-like methyltransferase